MASAIPGAVLAVAFAAALVLVPTFAPGPARADRFCGGDDRVVFQCTVQAPDRQVQICQQSDGQFAYRYGVPRAKPELELFRDRDALVYTPWNGMGTAVWASLAFFNGGYRYQVGFSEHRDGGDRTGTLDVFKPGADTPVISKFCRPDTLVHRLDSIADQF